MGQVKDVVLDTRGALNWLTVRPQAFAFHFRLPLPFPSPPLFRTRISARYLIAAIPLPG
jgi:hypothetical protein